MASASGGGGGGAFGGGAFGEEGAAAPRWRFGQCFGEKEDEEESEADVLTAVEFDASGDFLATGDKGGRIVVFERAGGGGVGVGGRKRPRAAGALPFAAAAGGGGGGGSGGGGGDDDGAAAELADGGGGGGGGGGAASASGAPEAEYRFLTEFQSHESEFDYLKSLEIEERINQVAWCRRTTSSLLLLSTNDKTIKLWKIHDKTVRMAASLNVEVGRYGGRVPVAQLRVPALVRGEAQTVATPRRVFSNAHTSVFRSCARGQSTCAPALANAVALSAAQSCSS